MPGPSVTPEELQRVFSTIRARHPQIPHDLFDLWEGAAQPYMMEHAGKYRGMDGKEVDKFISYVMTLTQKTHPNWTSVIPDFKNELLKAVKTTYGNHIGF